MSEKLCLKWNDFQVNTNTAFVSLRNDTDFTDVTLACNDGEEVQAHKVILAASSPIFQTLLRRKKHPNPLIFMSGVKSENLVAIVDFLYYGEAKVCQENLDAFLALAEDLEVKGLTGNNVNEPPEEVKSVPRKTVSPKNEAQTINKSDTIKPKYQTVQKQKIKNEMAVDIQPHKVWSVNISDVEKLDEKVKSMMTKSDNSISNGRQGFTKAAICTVCGKEGIATNIRNHIEANHLAGISIPCNVCETLFRSRDALGKHSRKHHL